MAYLLDTCALSELVAKKPHRPAVENILRLPREDIFLSTITIGEIQSGIDELQPCERKVFLQVWLEDHVLKLYSDRTIAVDIAVARVWGTLSANLIARGRTMQVKALAVLDLQHQSERTCCQGSGPKIYLMK